jgi:hypothetical protein
LLDLGLIEKRKLVNLLSSKKLQGKGGETSGKRKRKICHAWDNEENESRSIYNAELIGSFTFFDPVQLVG